MLRKKTANHAYTPISLPYGRKMKTAKLTYLFNIIRVLSNEVRDWALTLL